MYHTIQLNYEELENFIHKKMSMTHIYQPIMIRTLLESRDNTATVDDIARKFLNNDESQLNYYKKITKRWPHITLKKHGVISYEKNVYTLQMDKKLTTDEREHLKELCSSHLQQFIDRDPWIKTFRELDKKSINGSLRYDILSRSRGVCVACGARSTEAMLHVDHIVPRSLGGKTESGNLQALCYKCNTQKRDRDELDFLKHHNRLKFRNLRCPLCSEKKNIMSNDLAHATHPKNPLAEMHTLVTSNRHAGSFIDLIPAERQLCLNLVDDIIDHLKSNTTAKKFDVTGFDRSAEHFHIDVIPVPGTS
ncbi:MAG: HIT domain-containing protein [Nitrosopumilus sp. B06]|nr:MAG: HIT domain-containing protein [Nitrosopumilus sp. B06]